MNEPYLGQTTDMVLGQEFLTWLWFRSETQPMGFKDKEGVPFSMNSGSLSKVAKATVWKRPPCPVPFPNCVRSALACGRAKR